MAGTVYAIRVVATNGHSGYLKFYGDGTWDWQMPCEADWFERQDHCCKGME